MSCQYSIALQFYSNTYALVYITLNSCKQFPPTLIGKYIGKQILEYRFSGQQNVRNCQISVKKNENIGIGFKKMIRVSNDFVTYLKKNKNNQLGKTSYCVTLISYIISLISSFNFPKTIIVI